ncbi:hypothetical protein C7974DRAFT_441938 [Boeremia exigua]|uniref:uncharacterized protein n=1 Tax=Boeremia exigua TaxID=749465 RepID=UPI001E8EE38D|nr:uncharacterized protein C7974DRAFT_441938 [Boeremia exigua]KAH6616313.1 hypothetical protein C7974DRAFT_441938 [Boeremia exigua]
MSSNNTHLSGKDAHLYGAKSTARSKRKEISSSSTVAFSSTLSNLIKASSSNDANKLAGSGRARPQKDDIFKTHNKNVKKRALADLDDTDLATQKHRGRTTDEKSEDAASWKRTQRRMEEKARLYAALKRGDVEDINDKYGVDFDRKWADTQGASGAASSSSSESDDDEQVEYVDEFGRTRTGTRAEAAREQHRKATLAHDAPDRFTARPSMPEQLIFGDTVQTNAFNPDETIAQQMADLAAKRDKELTPPPELHFDGRAEARTRGTGFMYFDQDEEERRKQMANLEKERADTERVRRERKDAVEARKEMIREKRRVMAEKRSKGKAERFLDDLGVELGMGAEGGEGSVDVAQERGSSAFETVSSTALSITVSLSLSARWSSARSARSRM